MFQRSPACCQLVVFIVMAYLSLPNARAQDWKHNSDFNSELKYDKKYEPFSEGKITHFRPISLVQNWVYDSKTNVLFGAHPRGFMPEDYSQVVRYRVTDNEILEPIRDVKEVRHLLIKNRKLVVLGKNGKTSSLLVFDLDTNKKVADFETGVQKVTRIFCSQADNNFVYLVNPISVSQIDVATGKVVNQCDRHRIMNSGFSMTPDGKWLGYQSNSRKGASRSVCSFDEDTLTFGKIVEFRRAAKIVSKPKFQYWAVRESGSKDGIPTPILSRRDGRSRFNYALHPSIDLMAEGYSTKMKDLSNGIQFQFGIRFLNVEFENKLAELKLTVPDTRPLRRGHDNRWYEESIENQTLSTTTFDVEDNLAIATFGPHAFVIHLNETIAAAAPVAPPKESKLVDSGSGRYFAYPGEKVSFSVSLTENLKERIRILAKPKDSCLTKEP